MRFIKRLFYIYVCFFIFILLFSMWASYAELNFSISFVFYWMFLLGWILMVFIWRLTSGFSMKFAFSLTLLGVLLFVVNLVDISEVVLRLGFIGWLVGIVQAIIEYRGNEKK